MTSPFPPRDDDAPVSELLGAHVRDGVEALAKGFARARPFPHAVIDDFLAPELYRSLRDSFPPFARGDARNEFGNPGGTARCGEVRALGRAFQRLDDLVRSAGFLRWAARVSGISDLHHDPEYVGAGTCEHRSGQEEDPHIDSHGHPTRPWRRRLQLIVTLNDVWDERWGGNLELHRDPWNRVDEDVRTILPLGNRAVLLESSERSWHALGAMRIPSCEAVKTRRSFSLYLYSNEPVLSQRGHPYAAVSVERDLPSRIREDEVLDIDAQLEFVRLTQRRLDHSQRLMEREFAMIRQLRRSLQEDFPPGHPASKAWIDAARWLIRTQDEMLRYLYDREPRLSAKLNEVARMEKPVGLHGLPLFGPVVIMAWEGFWPGDCFVGEDLRVQVHFAEEVTRCTVVGNVPDDAPAECHLRLRFGDVDEERVFPRGIFSWEVTIAGHEDTQLPMRIQCSSTYSKKELGLHPIDDRRVSFQIRSLYFS